MASETIKERLLSIRETAEILGISTRQVHRLRSAGRICPFLKVGGSVRVRASTLTDWLNMDCPNLEEFLGRKEAAALTTAPKNTLQSRAYQRDTPESTAKLQIGTLLLALQSPMTQQQRATGWQVFAILLQQYVSFKKAGGTA